MTVRGFLPSPWSVVTGAACGVLLGWWLWHTEPLPAETAAPAVQLPSGGLLVERKPDAPAPAAVKKAAKQAGGKLERAVSITVQPELIPAPAVVFVAPPAPPVGEANPAMPAAGCSCAPVRIDLGLVRMPDRTRRVVATANGGEIVGGLDIPLDMPAPSRALRWAAGASAQAIVSVGEPRHYGAWVERDIGPFRLGGEVQATSRGTDRAAWLRVGIRF